MEDRSQIVQAALLDAARAVLQNREFGPAAAAIFTPCKHLLGAGAGYVSLLTPDGRENEVLYLDPGELACAVAVGTPMPVRGLRRRAVEERRSIWENDFPASAFAGLLPPGHAPIRNALFTPLRLEGAVVGLLGLANKPGGFGPEDVRVAEAFADFAAVALLHSRAFEELDAAERRLRAVTESAGDAIVGADGQGRIVFWNASAERVFGWSAAEVLGRPLSVLMPERLRGGHEAALRLRAARGAEVPPGRVLDFVGLRRDGSEFPLELTLASWRSRDGVFFTAVLRDLAERRKLERERAESAAAVVRERDFTAAVLDTVGALVVVLDRGGRVVRFNRECEALTGWSAAEMCGQPLWDRLIPDEALAGVHATFERLLEGRFPNGFENEWRTRDGGRRLVAWRNTALRGADGRVEYVVATGVDITEQRRAERERAQAFERERAARGEAEALAGLRERFMAILGHDLRQPLNVISTSVSALARAPRTDSETRAVARVERSVRRIAGMIADLLDYSRSRAPSGIPVELQAADLRDICRRVAEEHQATHDSVLVEAVGDCTGRWDPNRLQQVVGNLVGNALQHGTPGGVVRVGVHGDDDGVEVSVANDGEPIPPERLPALFEPFRGGHPRGHRGGGLGLGLYIVREIVQAHGGRVSVRSRAGLGTVFSVRLPRAGPAAGAERTPGPPCAEPPPRPRAAEGPSASAGR